MSKLRKQIRDYYDSRELSREKVDAILAEGRGETPQRATRRKAPLAPLAAIAAVLVGLLGALGLWANRDEGVDYAALRSAVIGFFVGEPAYGVMSGSPDDLRSWALEHGAPPEFRIPETLRVLPGKGCSVLDVDGKAVYMLCFMTVDPTGKQDGGMIHLVIARPDDFADPVDSGTPVLSAEGGWNFAAWRDGEVLYTLAAPLPKDVLESYLAGDLSGYSLYEA